VKTITEISNKLALDYKGKARDQVKQYADGDSWGDRGIGPTISSHKAIKRIKGMDAADRSVKREDKRQDKKYKDANKARKDEYFKTHKKEDGYHEGPWKFRHRGTEEDDKKLEALKAEIKAHNKDPNNKTKKRVSVQSRLGKKNPYSVLYHGPNAIHNPASIKRQHGAYHDVYVHDRYDRNEETKMAGKTINELSKKTLGSYINKAADDLSNHGFKAGQKWASRDMDFDTDIKPSLSKAMRRQKGLKLAGKRIAKEETEVNELSKKTLGSYINKAADSAARSHSKRVMADYHLDSLRRAKNDVEHHTGARLPSSKLGKYGDKSKDDDDAIRDVSMKNTHTSWKRITGIANATKKLTKEETEMDETYHDWKVKVHKAPDKKSEHVEVSVRARNHGDARKMARDKAPPAFLHALTAKLMPGTQLLNKRVREETEMNEDTDKNFGKNEPIDAGLKKKNNPLYGNATKVAKAGLSDPKGKGAAGSSVSPMKYFGKTKPKMDAIKNGKWDPLYKEDVEGEEEMIDDNEPEFVSPVAAVVNDDAVELERTFDAAIRAKIMPVLFPEDEDEDEEIDEKWGNNISQPMKKKGLWVVNNKLGKKDKPTKWMTIGNENPGPQQASHTFDDRRKAKRHLNRMMKRK